MLYVDFWILYAALAATKILSTLLTALIAVIKILLCFVVACQQFFKSEDVWLILIVYGIVTLKRSQLWYNNVYCISMFPNSKDKAIGYFECVQDIVPRDEFLTLMTSLVTDGAYLNTGYGLFVKVVADRLSSTTPELPLFSIWSSSQSCLEIPMIRS